MELKTTVLVSLMIVSCICPPSLQDCDRPTNLQDNVVITPDQSSYGTYYSYTPSCEPGYDVSGPTTIYCTAGSPDYWNPNPSLSVCNAAAQCPKPNITDPEIVISPDKDIYDAYDVITFNCSNGGDIEGSDSSTCQGDGTWNYPTEPICLDRCAAPINTNGSGTYAHNSVVTFSCIVGYSLSDGSDTASATCDDGTWSSGSGDCQRAGCIEPEVRENINVTPESDEEPDPTSGYYSINAKVLLECAGERTAVGPGYTYCNNSFQWEPEPMKLKCYNKCKAPSFDDDRLIHTSTLSTETGTEYYDHTNTMTFSCEGGLYVDGPWKSTCRDGSWSINVESYRPVCRDNCTAPLNADNEGDVFQHGDVHVFSCVGTPGMLRLGGPRAFCNDGSWKPRIQCALKSEL